MALKRTLTGVGPAVALNIADEDLSSAELRLRLQDWAVGDTISVSWDETQLIDPDVRYCQAGNLHGISSVSGAAWLHYDLGEIAAGPHQVKVALIERHPQLACDLILTDVEVVIRHG